MRRRINKIYDLMKRLLFASALGVIGLTPLFGNTLQEQLDQAVAAFTEGDYAKTYWSFELMELDYGTEPEFLAVDFQARTLPIRAYAALMADRPTDALVHFDTLLSSHKPALSVQAFILYNSAIAFTQTDSLEAAANSYKAFQTRFPGSNEAGLARLQEADLRNQLGQTKAAMALLDEFYESKAPLTLRMQARLRALQIASESEQTDVTQEILFNTDWSVEDMPDIAVLSFSALDAADLLLQEGLFADSISAYRLVYPRDTLLKKQRERLIATQEALNRESTFASSIWKSHSKQLISRLNRQLNLLEQMEDYTPGLYLRMGQAYLLAARYREAAILFRTISLSENFQNDIRAEAHYRWVLALCEAQNWETSRQTADSFLVEHRGHSLAKNALFLISRSYQGEGDFSSAIEVLDRLIETYPSDPMAARWYYTRGYNYSVLEDQVAARENFASGLERFPKSNLAEQTELWLALTYFFERNYAESLQRLEALSAQTNNHPIQPEILFRIANCHYATRDYAQTLKVADQLIENYPDHHRVSEMLALKGDTYMGLGELIQAGAAFKKVPAEDAQIYDYSIFQANKIYKALERYDLMQSNLESYIALEDANERPRVSEALYWIGWALQQQDRTEEALPIFDQTLTRFGNDPKARAVESILSAYAKIYAQYQRTDAAVAGFEVWLQNETEKSLSELKLTWFARLTMFRADQQLASGSSAAADAIVLTIHPFVPIRQQDPPTLARVGILLANKGYMIADEYFEYILDEYPKRSERAAAYYGKALLASQNNQLEIARRWLIRFLEETPTHPLAADVRLLTADVFTRQGLYQTATDVLNEILQLKEMRGRPHARALAGLARIENEQAQPKRAIAYWQRLYTLYRAYPDLIAEAYWESAQLFAQIDDPTAAYNTLKEFLKDERLQSFEAYTQASQALPDYKAKAEAITQLTDLQKEKASTP